MNKCECKICKNRLSFQVPKEIVDALETQSLILFVGAGVSTENPNVFKDTFYNTISEELDINNQDKVSFPDLMEIYSRKPNGRIKLLQRIRERFTYAKQFYELYNAATHFHRELAPIFQIKEIFTTNWDDYFENECGAIPIVSAEDFAFHSLPSRKVYKIHGSIDSFGSIVATTSDYKKCYKSLRDGALGSYMKSILATKVVVFIGYSFNDLDFNRIYTFLKKEMKSIIPHSYIVTPEKRLNDKIAKDNLQTHIKTDGTFFIESLKDHLVSSKKIIPPSNIEFVEIAYQERRIIHRRCSDFFLKHKNPKSIINLIYQDGLGHALQYLLHHSSTGMSFNPFHILKAIETYKNLKKDYAKAKNYVESVYIEGYLSGLFTIFQSDEKVPYYYIAGKGHISSEKEFKSLAKNKNIYHKSTDKQIYKVFKDNLRKDSELIPHHRAFL